MCLEKFPTFLTIVLLTTVALTIDVCVPSFSLRTWKEWPRGANEAPPATESRGGFQPVDTPAVQTPPFHPHCWVTAGA